MVPIQQPELLCSTQPGVACPSNSRCRRHRSSLGRPKTDWAALGAVASCLDDEAEEHDSSPRAPQLECPKPCGLRKAPKPGKSTLGLTFTPSRKDQRRCRSGVRGTSNS